ncbi:hypothetical protein BU15DRAFT_81156 [Melanogaster broomeanus]|nr:hypothetical protein BU15DRAFT_81156 [Melanogaster broomeanus]
MDVNEARWPGGCSCNHERWKRILSGGREERIWVWDAETQECIEEWESGPGSIFCIAISPDGQLAANGSSKGKILIRDLTEGGQIKHSLDGGNDAYSLCFSPNGEKLASCSVYHDDGMRVFDVESGKLILGSMGYKYTYSVIWSLDGTQLFSAHSDFTIRCWNSENGELIGGPWTGHTKPVRSLSLSPDGTKISSASYDRTVRFWDARTGDSIDQPLLHESELYAVTFSPSGEFVAAGGQYGKVSIWRVPWWDKSRKKVYDSLLDLPAVSAPKGLSSLHAPDEFRDLTTGATSRPLDRPAPIVTRIQRLLHGIVTPRSSSSPTQPTIELQPTSPGQRFWKSPVRTPTAAGRLTERVVVAKSRRKRRKEKKYRKSHKPPQPQNNTGADPSNAVAGPSSSHAQPSGAPSKPGPSTPSTPQPGPSTPSKPVPEGRASSFAQSNAGSDDSWDDLDGCGKCLDYFCGGPRPDRERFRPWKKKSTAVIQAEQRLQEAKRTANVPTKKHGRTQKGHTYPDEAPLEHPRDSPVDGAANRRGTFQHQTQNEQLRRQLHDAATAKRKAEERVNVLEKKFDELQYSSYKPRRTLFTIHSTRTVYNHVGSSSPPSNSGEVHSVDPPRHHNSQWDHTKAASQASPDADEATSDDLRDGRLHGANLPGVSLQLPEQTEEIHRRLDDEATARQRADGKLDGLEKEVKELRDIISLTSRGPLERQTHPGLSFMEAGPSTSTAGLSTSASRSSTSSSDPEQTPVNIPQQTQGRRAPRHESLHTSVPSLASQGPSLLKCIPSLVFTAAAVDPSDLSPQGRPPTQTSLSERNYTSLLKFRRAGKAPEYNKADMYAWGFFEMVYALSTSDERIAVTGDLRKPEVDFSRDWEAHPRGINKYKSVLSALFSQPASQFQGLLYDLAEAPEHAQLNNMVEERLPSLIDSVVGHETPSSSEKWCTLTKLHAFILEALRWRPVNPLGIPHRAARGVIWNGYGIPANAIVSGSH